MQPLAINPKNFENNFLNYFENIPSIVHMVENIENFHEIYKDTEGKWILHLERIRNKLEQNEKSMFDALITKKLQKKYVDVKIDDSDLLKSIALKTPDSLLISDDKISDVKNCYSQKLFNCNDYKPNNVLYRFPKPVKVKSNYKFHSFSFIAPYLRNASKIEIMDKQLFKDSRNDSEIKLLLEILKNAKEFKELQLYWELNEHNIRYKEFEKELLIIFPNLNVLPSQQYISRGKNHDRFIIVNKNELSIRFTCSFNNFYFKDKSFVTKAGFKIDYEKGRSFEDIL